MQIGCVLVLAFPAYAGMFPWIAATALVHGSFPRVCGDVSRVVLEGHIKHWLSPRMRGCFPEVSNRKQKKLAFPAYAGMFLTTVPTTASQISFPRVCGDVSEGR